MTPAVAACRVAIMRGPLIRDGKHFRFGRRLFSGATVQAAMAQLGGADIVQTKRNRGRIHSSLKPHRSEVTYSTVTRKSIEAIAHADGTPIAETIRRLLQLGIAERMRRERKLAREDDDE